MQALKQHKDPFKVLRFYTQAIVLHGKDPFSVALAGGDVYARCLGTTILNGITDEVLKHLGQLRRVTGDCR